MKSKKQSLVIAILLAVVALAATPVMAGTDTTFSVGVMKLTGFLAGSGGMLVALIAVITAAVAGTTGNIKTALSALGVAIIASIGPSIAASFFTATLFVGAV